MLHQVLSRLRSRAPIRRRADAFQLEEIADDGPFLGPGGRACVVGDVEGLAAGFGGVQRGPDAEFGQDVLAAVVAEDGPGGGGAGEFDGGAGAGDGGVAREVECLFL